MDWKKYENEVFEALKTEYPDDKVIYNTTMVGRFSEVDRQIDTLIERSVSGNKINIVIDAKFYEKNIDVKGVETFLGMLSDVGAQKGILVTQKGYSKAAIKRAFNDKSSLELDILSLEELENYQGLGAILYAGSHGVLISSPFGWVIDSRSTEYAIAHSYQRGITFESAQKENEWMYMNIWDKTKSESGFGLKDLLRMQEERFISEDIDVHIEYLDTIKRDSEKVKLRKVRYKENSLEEYTGFIEFENFIFFAVVITKIESSFKNITKLENLLIQVREVAIQN